MSGADEGLGASTRGPGHSVHRPCHLPGLGRGNPSRGPLRIGDREETGLQEHGPRQPDARTLKGEGAAIGRVP